MWAVADQTFLAQGAGMIQNFFLNQNKEKFLYATNVISIDKGFGVLNFKLILPPKSFKTFSQVLLVGIKNVKVFRNKFDVMNFIVNNNIIKWLHLFYSL